MEPIRIFIGVEPKQWLPAEVLRWSVLRRTNAPVEFQELKHIPLNLKGETYSVFPLYRFAVPQKCGYKERAIYLDADVVVLDDIQNLFNMNLGSHGALARPIKAGEENGRYTSVMLLDNEKLKNWNLNLWAEEIDKNRALYNDLLWVSPSSPHAKDFGDLPSYWNDLDHCDEKTKILHYTNVATQPWKHPGHSFASVFLKELKAAIVEEEIPRDAVEREIRHGHLYPELLQDMEKLSE